MPKVALAASSKISAEAGAALADAGGNAVDAVLGAALVSMCTDIGIVSPGGGALLTVWPADGDPVVIDGLPEMPGRGQPSERLGRSMWDVAFDYKGETHQGIGFGSVATPGAFAALDEASRRFGKLPWEHLVQPAIRYAESGFPLSGGAAEYLGYTHEAIYSWLEESYRLFHHADGSPLVAGDVVAMPELATSLKEIAADGTEILYRGALGRRLAAGVQDADGLLSEADLAAYRAQTRKPITLDFHGWRIATCPPPSVGGPCLAALLHLLSACPQCDVNAETMRWLAESQRAVFKYRAETLDGAGEEITAEVNRLLSLARLGEPLQILSSPSTIHISGVDSDGLACSLTASAGYGSGAIASGTGILLNNSLGEVDLHPQGLAQVAPGTRLLSNMAPAVARSDDGAVLAIGSPGAGRITTAIAQSLWHHIVFGETLEAAVAHPRLHVEPYAATRNIAYEQGLPVPPMDDFELREFDELSM
ncbi:MAG: gamma-glutamyltransferase [Gammaproteobacteria bacterium]|nr:gamma-glutamyltransferase [Gammaproteobacteria bacterium]